DNTKGTFVTTSALQRGGLNFATAKGIGVIRLLPDNQVEHVLDFITSSEQSPKVNWSEFNDAFTRPMHRSTRSFFAYQGGFWFPTWLSLLSHELERHKD